MQFLPEITKISYIPCYTFPIYLKSVNIYYFTNLKTNSSSKIVIIIDFLKSNCVKNSNWNRRLAVSIYLSHGSLKTTRD